MLLNTSLADTPSIPEETGLPMGAELLAARDHLEHTVEMSPAVIFLLREVPDGSVLPTWVSDNVVRITGFTAGEAMGATWWYDNVHPEDRDMVLDALRALRTGNSVVTQEYRFRHRDGTYLWIRANVRRLENGEHRQLAGCWTDVTDRRREQEEVEHRRQVLAQTEKLADMGSLLAGVAHELNNPLAVVLGQAELIRRYAVGNASLEKRVDSMYQAADRCARIVRNFLGMARQYPPERRRVGVNQVVRDAVELLAYSLRVDNVEIDLALSQDIPAAWGDEHQLHQVIVNLVTNAHHALRAKPTGRRIRVATRCQGVSHIAVSVEDSGPGVPDELKARIFEPFFTTKPAGQGTGLGLSLCRGIVQAHGGTVTLGDTDLGGASFTILLPLDGHPVGEAAAHRVEGESAVKYSILVVDDEPTVLEVMSDILTEAGHQVSLVKDGEEALRELRTTRYDLVLSDVRMPGMDGIALFREASAMPAPTRFVFMTGDGLEPETAHFLGQSGRVSLEKPFSADDVRAAVRQVFDGRH